MVHQTMNTSNSPAPRASSKINHMSRVLPRTVRGWTALAILGSSLAGCSFAPKRPPLTVYPEPVEPPPLRAPAPPPAPAPQTLPPVASIPEIVRPTTRGRWVMSDWSALPGWQDDSLIQAWPALLRSCAHPAAGWAEICRAARALDRPDELMVRTFLRERLQPWRVESTDGRADGLMTGYFEPYIEASRTPSARFGVPLYAMPADLLGAPPRPPAIVPSATALSPEEILAGGTAPAAAPAPAPNRQAWYTRAQIDADPLVRGLLRGREIAWVADPLDALLLQIQGSGRLVLTDPNGQRRIIRLAYAGDNRQPYQSIGRWLVDQGAFTLEQASWPAIRNWARRNPQRVREMLAVNPRYIFFREEALPDPNVGPLGAQGVALIPGRSIAVDRDSVPYGTPVWIASTDPQAWSASAIGARPLQRLVLAQDTGSAINGAVRADYFWGWGDGIEDIAGRTKQPLRMWVLWPRG